MPLVARSRPAQREAAEEALHDAGDAADPLEGRLRRVAEGDARARRPAERDGHRRWAVHPTQVCNELGLGLRVRGPAEGAHRLIAEDDEAVAEMMQLADDENITWEEE